MLPLSGDSEALEGKVPEEPKDGPLPHEDVRRLVHRLDPVVDQGHDVPELTAGVRQDRNHLRLGCLEAVWVLLPLLVVGEEGLTRGGGVGVRTGKDHLHTKLQ